MLLKGRRASKQQKPEQTGDVAAAAESRKNKQHDGFRRGVCRLSAVPCERYRLLHSRKAGLKDSWTERDFAGPERGSN